MTMSILFKQVLLVTLLNSNSSLYTNGKIYVVVIVLAVVLAIFFLILYQISNKIKSIEDKINLK